MNEEKSFTALQGLTLTSIEAKVGDDCVKFTTKEGRSFRLEHMQDCCEHVRLEDVTGDVEDLLGSPVTLAEEASNADGPAQPNSYTWTFYKLRTLTGDVTLRFLGESNGYYSEEVSFFETSPTETES